MKKLKLLITALMFIPLTVVTQELQDIDFISPFNDGLSAIQKNDKWAFINKEGEIVIDFRDDVVLSTLENDSYPIFNSGRCLIVQKEDGISYFGYIDKTGKSVIKPKYLNATNFNNGIAVILELHKNIVGQNDALDKTLVRYTYTESSINVNAETVHYLSEEPTHVTLSKDFLKEPPQIKSKFITENLIAVQTKDHNWSIKKVKIN